MKYSSLCFCVELTHIIVRLVSLLKCSAPSVLKAVNLNKSCDGRLSKKYQLDSLRDAYHLVFVKVLSVLVLPGYLAVHDWLVGWLCFTSHRQRGHLETAPPFTDPCERREARFLHRSHRELNPRPSHGSSLHFRCATPAPRS